MYVTSQFCYWMVRNCQNGYEFHKSRFAVDRSDKLIFLTDYNNGKDILLSFSFSMVKDEVTGTSITMKTFKMF